MFAIQEDNVEVGDKGSSSRNGEGIVCVLDMTSVRALVGVMREEAVSGVVGSGGRSWVAISGTRRAGFGNVLYVEPREVYLSEIFISECQMGCAGLHHPLTPGHINCSMELANGGGMSRRRHRTNQ